MAEIIIMMSRKGQACKNANKNISLGIADLLRKELQNDFYS